MSNFYFRIDKPKVSESHRNIPFYNQVFLLGDEKAQAPPSIIYKYMRIGEGGKVDFTKRLLDTLLEGAFWFSTKQYLNDPCEMSYVDIAAETIPPPHPKATFHMSPLSKEVANNFNLCRISCFSESWNIGPMWDRYSGGQSGVCLGFETSQLTDSFFPVIYQDEVEEDFLRGEQGLLNAFSLKNEDWSYEKEWRLIYPWTPFKIKENINNINLGLIQSLNMPVKEIVFGNQVKTDIKNMIIDTIKTEYECEIYKTVINNKIERMQLN